jgi:hypothetical protein
MKPESSDHLILAYHWREWAISIDGANELTGQVEPIEFVPFLDASEVIEYVYPYSLMRGQFPTRLDLSLSLLFTSHDPLFVFGPHAQEINGVRTGWRDRMAFVLDELKLLKASYDTMGGAEFEQELEDISADIRNRAEDLVQLLSKYHDWIFAAWRVPHDELPTLFDRVLRQLHRPSIEDLRLPADFVYKPDESRIDEWLRCLDETENGKGEPGPNMVDAYVLDQLAQIAQVAPRDRLPILFTHSSKIFEAVQLAPKELAETLRVHGVSVLHPPQVALVLRLRNDAIANGTLQQLTEELERQRVHCREIGALVDEINARKRSEQPEPSELHKGVKQELRRLDDLSMQWNALENLRQTMDADVRSRTTGMAEGLREILQSRENGNRLRELLGDELARLIREVDHLQAEIARRPLADEEPKGELEIEEHSGELTAFVVPNSMMRRRGHYVVPSAAYPMAAFRFRDARMRPYLEQFRDALKLPESRDRNAADERERVVKLWRLLKEFTHLQNHPEHYLVLAVVYLAQERWLQAYDMAGDGILCLSEARCSIEDHLRTDAHVELLLTRACAARAFVHATRVEVPSACRAFLQTAIVACFDCLELQEQNAPPDARCLRELAVIFGSSLEPLYGPGDSPASWESLNLSIDRARLSAWVDVPATANARLAAAALARRAWELGQEDESLKHFFVNTHLYAMTEVDRELLLQHRPAVHEEERLQMAAELECGAHHNDANFTDTLMWHEHVLGFGRKTLGQPSGELAEKAHKRSKQIIKQNLDSNLYYRRLVIAHRQAINVARPRWPAQTQ